MIEIIEKINPDLFGNQLCLHLSELNRKSSMPELVNEIEVLCGIELEEFEKINITFEKLSFLQDFQKCNNKEILARWYEYLFRKTAKNKKNYLQESVSLYIEIFEITKKTKYLKHSLSLVKMAKGIFYEQMSSLYKISKETIENLECPDIQKQLLQELSSIFPKKVKSDFENYLRLNIQAKTELNNYSSVIHIIEALKIIKVIKNQEYRIMLAENYEKEGDFQSNNKKQNTFYPSILITYEKALRELKSIECPDELRKRIEGKVLKEQKEQVRMHSAVANSYSDINTSQDKLFNEFGDGYLKVLKINNFNTGFSGLLAIKIDLVKSFTQSTENNKKPFLSSLLSGSHKIDRKGKVIGKCSIEKSDDILGRMLWRECMINFVNKSKWIMNEDKIPSREDIYRLIFRKSNTIFVPEDRKILFLEGIYAGFADDFILAAHLLVPQIENSLKVIAEKSGLLTAKIYAPIQDDNMLGGILDKLIDKYNYELFVELKDFLIEKNSVNFRNELCHGLLAPFEMAHYGSYLWWLCLKMITDNEGIFDKIINTKRQ